LDYGREKNIFVDKIEKICYNQINKMKREEQRREG
jgi:hypothetical protein